MIIALDWTRPWTFIEELQMWLVWVERWAKGDSSRELEIVREEQRERRTCLDAFLEHPFIAVWYQSNPISSIIPNLHQNPYRQQPIQAHYFR